MNNKPIAIGLVINLIVASFPWPVFAAPVMQCTEEYVITQQDIDDKYTATERLGLKGNYDLARKNGRTDEWYIGKKVIIPCGYGDNTTETTSTSTSSLWSGIGGGSGSSTGNGSSGYATSSSTGGGTTYPSGEVTPEPRECVDPVTGSPVSQEAQSRLCFYQSGDFRVHLATGSAAIVLAMRNPKIFAALTVAALGLNVLWYGSMNGQVLNRQQILLRSAAWAARPNSIPIATTIAIPGNPGRPAQPTSSPRRIAILDDDVESADSMLSFVTAQFSGAQVDIFTTCHQLIARVQIGIRYSAYIFDYNLGSGLATGAACATQLLAVHPNAIIIGQSMDDHTTEFLGAGAKAFVLRSKGAWVVVETLARFLR